MYFDFAAIPQELRDCPQWVCWRFVPREGAKPTKVPINARNGENASTTDATTWGTYDEALVAYNQYSCISDSVASNRLNGIGFVFSDYDLYTGIDIDWVGASEAELKAQWGIVQRFDSYTEYSPSGNGVHVIVKGRVNKGTRRHGVEIYSSGRYFTFTGKTLPGFAKPIEARQALLDILEKDLRPNRVRHALLVDCPQVEDDDTIRAKVANAANREKALRLIAGDGTALSGTDRSGSAIDMAIVNIIQFYTQNVAQIERLWLSTPHAAKPERLRKLARDDYRLGTIQQAFDQTVTPVDFSEAMKGVSAGGAAPSGANAALGNGNGNAAVTAPPARRKLRRYDVPVNPYAVPPPGLVGSIAHFIHAQAPRPVAEIALAGAIAWMAGVAGKAFNVSGEGLNLYIACLASSGTGKEAVSRGYGKIQTALTAVGLEAIDSFMGPGDFASVPGLLKAITEKRSCVSIITEFGEWLSQMLGDRANPTRKAIKAQLLSLYSKSGAGAEYYETVYSDKANTIAKITAPALTVYGESTPSTFYRNITQQVIEDGFLPRFIIIEYDGPAPRINKKAFTVDVPDMLRMQLAQFVTHCLKLNSPQPAPVGSTKMSDLVRPLIGPTDVAFSDDCVSDVYAFNDYCTDQANETEIEGIKNLWSRVWVNTVKLAALCAVGRNANSPQVGAADFDWARGIVLHSMYKIVDKVTSGQIAADAESAQAHDLERLLAEVPTYTAERAATYGLNAQMAVDGYINTGWLHKRLAPLAAFRQDRMGRSFAIKRVVSNAVERGLLVETVNYPHAVYGQGKVYQIALRLLSQ